MKIIITPQGRARFLYQEQLSLRPGKIERASHVEPEADGWWVTIVQDGTRLGPFQKRSEALKAEVDYVEKMLEQT